MNGITDEITSNFIGIDGHISIYSKNSAITNPEELIAGISAFKEIKTITKRVEGQVMVSSKKRAFGAQIIGLSKTGLANKERISNNIVSGDITDFSAGSGIIIGKRLADNLRASVGDSVTLISPQGRRTFAGFVPRIKSYKIRAILSLGMHMIDSSTIIMPYSDAAIYFQLPKNDGKAQASATSLSISLSSLENTSKTVQKIDETLNQNSANQYFVYDYKTSNKGIFTALNIQRDVMIIILSLIILVAAFNIISSLIMLVQDKSRDTSILRTMGASRQMILQIFVLTGLFIGIVGTLLGLILGIFAANNIEAIRHGIETIIGQELLVGNIYFLSSLPTKTNVTEVGAIVAMSIALSFISTIYPAWRASKQDPATALRY